jgi:membrane-associated phospholipid phosphatase
VHFPSDIVAGALLGSGIAWLVNGYALAALL